MKRNVSIFLICCMLFACLPVSASASCSISFNTNEAVSSVSGTTARLLNTNVEPRLKTYGNATGWLLDDSIASGNGISGNYGHSNIYIDLADDFMHNLSGERDVVVSITYYDGDSTTAGDCFAVEYHSQSLTNEVAKVFTLGGSGEWITQSVVLEKPYFADTGSPVRNITVGVYSTHLYDSYNPGYGSVVISDIDVSWGEVRKAFLDVSSTNYGNVFFGDEAIKMNCLIENPTVSALGDLTVNWTAVGEASQNSYSGSGLVNVHNRTTNFGIDFEELPFDVYTLNVQLLQGKTVLAADTVQFSRVKALGGGEAISAVGNQSDFGVNTHATTFSTDVIDDVNHLIGRSGANMSRIMMSWTGVEKTAGNLALQDYHRKYIESAHKNGQEVLVTLGNWNSVAYPQLYPYRRSESEEGVSKEEAEEEFQSFLTAFGNYVSFMVESLKDEVHYWEIFNEYDNGSLGAFPYFTANTDTENPERAASYEDYFDILKTGYEAVKAADPTAVVIGGVTGGLRDCEEEFVRGLYQMGAADYMDVLSCHDYVGMTYLQTDNIDMILQNAVDMRAIIDEYGGTEELWLTEFNFNADHTRELRGKEYQTKHSLKIFLRNMFKNYFDKMFYYEHEALNYTDTICRGMITRAEDMYDVLPVAGGATLSYLAFSFYNKMTACAEPVSMTVDDNGAYVCEFYDTKHQRPLYVVFNYAARDEVEVSSSVRLSEDGVELSAYDMYGNFIEKANDSLDVTVGSQPVYIAGPEKAISEAISTEERTVTLTSTSTPNSEVSVIVLKEGVTESEFKAAQSPLESIMYLNEATVDSDGFYSVSFKIEEDNGTYKVILTEADATQSIYNLKYTSGKLSVAYSLTQNGNAVNSFNELVSGDLKVNFDINNPQQTESNYVLIGAMYKDNKLIKNQVSQGWKLNKDQKTASGEFTISNINPQEIDSIKIFIFDDFAKLRPLYKLYEIKMD